MPGDRRPFPVDEEGRGDTSQQPLELQKGKQQEGLLRGSLPQLSPHGRAVRPQPCRAPRAPSLGTATGEAAPRAPAAATLGLQRTSSRAGAMECPAHAAERPLHGPLGALGGARERPLLPRAGVRKKVWFSQLRTTNTLPAFPKSPVRPARGPLDLAAPPSPAAAAPGVAPQPFPGPKVRPWARTGASLPSSPEQRRDPPEAKTRRQGQHWARRGPPGTLTAEIRLLPAGTPGPPSPERGRRGGDTGLQVPCSVTWGPVRRMSPPERGAGEALSAEGVAAGRTAPRVPTARPRDTTRRSQGLVPEAAPSRPKRRARNAAVGSEAAGKPRSASPTAALPPRGRLGTPHRSRHRRRPSAPRANSEAALPRPRHPPSLSRRATGHEAPASPLRGPPTGTSSPPARAALGVPSSHRAGRRAPHHGRLEPPLPAPVPGARLQADNLPPPGGPARSNGRGNGGTGRRTHRRAPALPGRPPGAHTPRRLAGVAPVTTGRPADAARTHAWDRPGSGTSSPRRPGLGPRPGTPILPAPRPRAAVLSATSRPAAPGAGRRRLLSGRCRRGRTGRPPAARAPHPRRGPDPSPAARPPPSSLPGGSAARRRGRGSGQAGLGRRRPCPAARARARPAAAGPSAWPPGATDLHSQASRVSQPFPPGSGEGASRDRASERASERAVERAGGAGVGHREAGARGPTLAPLAGSTPATETLRS
ncbi:collagen alpha-1(I) chain-like [Phyllostomus discolor]|uniref:Collagen alpha-1(I) chain-like n=1 Tax=Phyllostomus discolor TaxID=89673 RepID=A0A6J2MNG2_9CHIR|nr:collagen alpha-1(I) chain-like [Phyllostomus discolor]